MNLASLQQQLQEHKPQKYVIVCGVFVSLALISLLWCFAETSNLDSQTQAVHAAMTKKTDTLVRQSRQYDAELGDKEHTVDAAYKKAKTVAEKIGNTQDMYGKLGTSDIAKIKQLAKDVDVYFSEDDKNSVTPWLMVSDVIWKTAYPYDVTATSGQLMWVAYNKGGDVLAVTTGAWRAEDDKVYDVTTTLTSVGMSAVPATSAE